MFNRTHLLALAAALIFAGLLIGCTDDTNYDQRTVIYVASMNEGEPYICDVLNQGDSLYERDGHTYKTEDDYVSEDYILVEFHNKPYSTVAIDPTSSLGDFLVTGYDVSFTPLGSAPVPVPPFSGVTSILVPANGEATGAILLVPVYAKNIDPLNSIKYVWNVEYMTIANFTFRGHEIRTDREITFNTALTVNFADILTEEQLR